MTFSKLGLAKVTRLLSALTAVALGRGERKRLSTALSTAFETLTASSENILDSYYQPFPTERNVLAHGDLFANLLVRTAEILRREDAALSATIASLNRALHGLDYFPILPIPQVLKLVHPLGSVISGRADMGNYVAVYQGVTVGAARFSGEGSIYPRFSERTILFSGSSVLGDCVVGTGVVFAANSSVIDQHIPDDSIVVGQFPNHRFLPGGRTLVDQFFK